MTTKTKGRDRLHGGATQNTSASRNPGRTKGEAAALAVGGVMVFPLFQGDRPEKATDFNDLHQAESIDAVRHIVMAVVEVLSDTAEEPIANADVPPTVESVQPESTAIPPAANNDVEIDVENDEPVLEPSPFPGEEARPCYVVLDDWTECAGRKYRPGVYFCGMTEAKKDTPAMAFDLWFCSPLYIDAVTFDGQANNFGRLLRFKNSLGRWREWAMPMELLRGAGDELRGELLAMGVELDPLKARQQLPAYLQREHPKRRMHCALQVGWTGKSFVLPDQVIGPDAAGVTFQSGERGHEEHTKAGTLGGWQEGISLKASGNPLLLIALSAGFAGPMLARCNAEGGGIHFVGDSSTGKTTAIEASCSIWGGPNYRRSWRATANGMEGAAALFNDCLLALDEISECDPKEVGAIVYAKARRALIQESRDWWDHHVEEEEHPATAEGLAEFIRDSLEPICLRMEREARFTPAIKAQTLGEGLQAHRLEKLNRYETHLDRKFERTLAMLLKLKDLRGA